MSILYPFLWSFSSGMQYGSLVFLFYAYYQRGYPYFSLIKDLRLLICWLSISHWIMIFLYCRGGDLFIFVNVFLSMTSVYAAQE